MSKDYKPYYRTNKIREDEKKEELMISILFFAVIGFAFIGFAFVLVKAMLYISGLIL
jgi:pilus assembly protein TadC